MPDFHQTGVVATLHRFGTPGAETIERQVSAFAGQRPIALVLPCLFSEFSRPAPWQIIEELRRADWLDQVVVSLGRARLQDLVEARRAFSRLPQRVTFLWNDGPALQSLYAELARAGFDVLDDGKGRSCWIAYGYLLADGRATVIASHDCDITTYSREMLARLCYPLVHPGLNFEFAKGYYARVGVGLNGRVTRLFVVPLIRALERIVGPHPLLEYYASFRYPLAGEFAMRADLALMVRPPGNWGLEVGMLAEVFRHCGRTRICQTDLCANYDHKHQSLSAGDPGQGLLRMSIEVAQTLLGALASEGVAISDTLAKTLLVAYRRWGQDAVAAYEADAAINGLPYNRDTEETMVEVFGRGLAAAAARHLDDPLSVPSFPSWSRVIAALPGVQDALRHAVEEDSAMAARREVGRTVSVVPRALSLSASLADTGDTEEDRSSVA